MRRKGRRRKDEGKKMVETLIETIGYYRVTGLWGGGGRCAGWEADKIMTIQNHAGESRRAWRSLS